MKHIKCSKYVAFSRFHGFNVNNLGIIKLEHIRSVSKNRLTEYMTDLNDNKGVIKEIEEKLKDMLCIK